MRLGHKAFTAAPCKPAVPRHNARRKVVASAAASNSTAPPPPFVQPPLNPVLTGAVEALFRFPPFFDMASKKARNMIVQRADALGLDWNTAMEELRAQDWEGRLKRVEDSQVTFPQYYTQPFHAYPQGNLCWEAALEATLASISVHAPVMDPTGKTLQRDGDEQLRGNFGRRLMEILAEMDGGKVRPIKDVVDLGCATGLSCRYLSAALPGASITGVDLSPHFVAVAQYEQEQREVKSGMKESIRFMHAAAEHTGLASESADMVAVSLVFHELPQSAASAFLREAYRLLRPGGVLAIMEMNPASPVFSRIFSNPIVYTAFKSTEPWLQEYITLDLHGAIRAAGFRPAIQRENTPRHRTVVAIKD